MMNKIPTISEESLRAGGRLAFISPEPQELYLVEVIYNQQYGMYWIFFDGKLSEYPVFDDMMINLYDMIADYHLEPMEGIALDKFLNAGIDPDKDIVF